MLPAVARPQPMDIAVTDRGKELRVGQGGSLVITKENQPSKNGEWGRGRRQLEVAYHRYREFNKTHCLVEKPRLWA